MKITAFCTLETGLNALSVAKNNGVEIDLIVGLDPCIIGDKDNVTGYVDVSNFAKNNLIKYHLVKDYSLIAEKEFIEEFNSDLVWVFGWQRLIPNELLKKENTKFLGVHGSCDGITKGRGRSPQNWALIMGKRSFEVSVFQMDVGIDSGKIISTHKFNYDYSDTIKESYLKVTELAGKSLADCVRNPNFIREAQSQEGVPEYFPKRTTNDGYIDWENSQSDIYNQIRALSPPYPCARTIYKGNTLRVIKSVPFDNSVDEKPGIILAHNYDNSLLVQARDGTVLITDHEQLDGWRPDFLIGSSFESIPMKETVRTILDRFTIEFTGKKLNESLRKFWLKRDLL